MNAKEEQERLFQRQLKRIYENHETPTNQWESLPKTISDICLDLRGSCNGSADPWDSKFLLEVIEMLKLRRKQFDRGNDHPMDMAVLQMISSAIEIGEAEMDLRNKYERTKE